MDKYEYIVNLAEKTAKRVSQNRESWMKFLTSAARIYKYPFKEQLLIYAQNPDATACASIEIWNKRMNCWVNKGSSGIALPDDTATYGHKLKYVFDVSNVHAVKPNGRYPKAWKLREEHKSDVLHPDSAYIHFDEVGAVLFIFRANPSLKELDGFEKKFEIRITEFSKIMFISFRFGSSDWCSISYSPYLDTWQSKQFIFPNCKYGINLFIALFDTSTGKILRARMLDLPCLFSKKIRSAIVLQALQPFNKEKYIKVIKQFTFFHSQEEIAVQSKLSSRCTVHYRASQTVPIQK